MNDCELFLFVSACGMWTLGCGAAWALELRVRTINRARRLPARIFRHRSSRRSARSRYRGSAGLVVLIVVGLLALVTMIGSLAGDSESNPRPSPTGPRPAEYAQFEAAVREAIASGVLHSVDPESGTVRMDASIWVGLTLEQKRDSLRVWRAYFQSLGKSGRVRVLCDRNDTVFATLDSWNGAKILW